MLQTFNVDATFMNRITSSRVQMPVEASNGETAILAVEQFYRRVKPRAKIAHATAWPANGQHQAFKCAARG